MSSAKEIASQVFPHFADAVLARKVRSYGYYARLIGRDVAKESITIGPAMHLIGAICVVQQLPVAPLHFVERANGQARQIFASDVLESFDVLPHFDTLYVAAREYEYSAAEFERLRRALQKVMIEKAPPDWTPHEMWHKAILRRPKGSQETYFERALQRYIRLLDELRVRKQRK